jgi:hypothetical protein
MTNICSSYKWLLRRPLYSQCNGPLDGLYTTIIMGTYGGSYMAIENVSILRALCRHYSVLSRRPQFSQNNDILRRPMHSHYSGFLRRPVYSRVKGRPLYSHYEWLS